MRIKFLRIIGIAAMLSMSGAYAIMERDRLAAFLPQAFRAEAAVAPAMRAAQPVRVTVVRFAPTRSELRYTGIIRPQSAADFGFRLAGKLAARSVDVGDVVVKGDVLARLDATDLALQLDVAEAELAAAHVNHERAVADEARARALFKAGHVAQAALDRAASATAEAASRMQRAARAQELASNQVSYAELKADTDGIVTAVAGEAGQVVAAGQPVVTMAQSSARDVVFALPEQQRALLDGAEATAELWGDGGRAYRLTPRDISPDVDLAGRTYRVRMAMASPDAVAALGRTVTVRLTLPAAPPTAPVPLAGVLNTGDGAHVWRMTKSADRVERVAVEIVSVESGVVHLRGPLADGDRIVSLGAHKLDPARPVRVVETAAVPEI
jgi:membrane fusion protein, multidrug efflux system